MRNLPRTTRCLLTSREDTERSRDGIIPGPLHVPYTFMDNAAKPGGLLHADAVETATPIVLYCAFGERSALALKNMKEAGLENSCHLGGGIDTWAKEGGPLEFPVNEGNT
jgi:sulfur dioxygenase